MQEIVEYRDIPGFPDYRIGDDGSAWSRRRIGRRGGTSVEWRRLKALWNRRGYLYHGLRRDGRNLPVTVHKLVLQAFVGPRPEGMEACHRDGDRTNNSLSNLRWDTRRANTDDRTAHGTCPHGEGHYLAKLTEERVREMRRLHAEGWGYKRLAKEFKLNESTARSAVIRETWKHV